MSEDTKKIIDEVKDIIIFELGENFNSKDDDILENILKRAIRKAMFVSNRKENADNILILEDEIISYTKTIYLQRGVEDVTSLSTSGKSSSFVNADENLRRSIIKNNKRVIK